MAESIKFGDIFLYKEKEHVFLAKTAETTYAAMILDKKSTDYIKYLDDQRASKPDSYKSTGHKLYCYVILSTEAFRERMAHFANSDHNEGDIVFNKSGITLNKEDMEKIKKEICIPSSPVALELKQLVAQLDV